MPGVSLDQGQLQQQINWNRYNGPISFQNFRYSGLLQEQTDSNGYLFISFVPSFDNEILGFSATLDFSGGSRRWDIGFETVTRFGFDVHVWDLMALGAPVANTTVGIYYMAAGR